MIIDSIIGDYLTQLVLFWTFDNHQKSISTEELFESVEEHVLLCIIIM